jgi:hypothetical protein
VKACIRAAAALAAGLALAGCATTKVNVAEAKGQKDFASLVLYLGASADSEKEKASRDEVVKFILENKDEARPVVADSLSAGKGAYRMGGASVAWEWADRDFVEPLFAGLSEPDLKTRTMVVDAIRKQRTVLDEGEKEAVALRLVKLMEGEKEAYILGAYASALAAYAVKATHEPLMALDDAWFKSKTKNYNVRSLAEAILFGTSMREALDATAP